MRVLAHACWFSCSHGSCPPCCSQACCRAVHEGLPVHSACAPLPALENKYIKATAVLASVSLCGGDQTALGFYCMRVLKSVHWREHGRTRCAWHSPRSIIVAAIDAAAPEVAVLWLQEGCVQALHHAAPHAHLRAAVSMTGRQGD